MTDRVRRLRAWSVHVLTASGITFDLLAVHELLGPAPDARRVFLLLLVPVIIDGIDGPLARRWEVKRWAAAADGRTIDDIVDYLTFTFVPLLMVWRLGWLPEPGVVYVGIALVASLLGFAHAQAKQEEDGFFRGFPSYWNAYAFYAGLLAASWGPAANAALLLVLAALTMAPVRFLYPNLAPAPWRMPVLLGAAAWTALLLAMLPDYPRPPAVLVALSLVYPAFYVALSVALDARARARRL